eukprot:CAMPEP_0119339284 /NCGR_PEP_ID=MMETSP1333-20130426/97942_1 /TAXON_ID=418940 /ORGANISM="Scyphosphaera apsteinii, Strain RCC1455" /LENGTH=157 /DNA_ID=CAMNT_0007350779 /DNA_START=22 /DNA_END=492 /DNA_ORIENTATION=-
MSTGHLVSNFVENNRAWVGDASSMCFRPESPRLFYSASKTPGVGLQFTKHREPIAYVQPLSDHLRASLLEDLANFIPNHYCQRLMDYEPRAKTQESSSARKHFESLLARVQQAELAAAVQNELRLRQPEKIWCRNRQRYFHSALSGQRPETVGVDAW